VIADENLYSNSGAALDTSTTSPVAVPAPLGVIEPHAPLLRLPPEGQLLYKIMTVENLLRSIEGGYLHFNRVDSYTDLLNGDPHDGQQLTISVNSPICVSLTATCPRKNSTSLSSRAT
jgi:hypothetical protein